MPYEQFISADLFNHFDEMYNIECHSDKDLSTYAYRVSHIKYTTWIGSGDIELDFYSMVNHSQNVTRWLT